MLSAHTRAHNTHTASVHTLTRLKFKLNATHAVFTLLQSSCIANLNSNFSSKQYIAHLNSYQQYVADALHYSIIRQIRNSCIADLNSTLLTASYCCIKILARRRGIQKIILCHTNSSSVTTCRTTKIPSSPSLRMKTTNMGPFRFSLHRFLT